MPPSRSVSTGTLTPMEHTSTVEVCSVETRENPAMLGVDDLLAGCYGHFEKAQLPTGIEEPADNAYSLFEAPSDAAAQKDSQPHYDLPESNIAVRPALPTSLAAAARSSTPPALRNGQVQLRDKVHRTPNQASSRWLVRSLGAAVDLEGVEEARVGDLDSNPEHIRDGAQGGRPQRPITEHLVFSVYAPLAVGAGMRFRLSIWAYLGSQVEEMMQVWVVWVVWVIWVVWVV